MALFALRDQPPAKAEEERDSVGGLTGPRRLHGACALISSVPAARGTVWGSQGGGAGTGGI